MTPMPKMSYELGLIEVSTLLFSPSAVMKSVPRAVATGSQRPNLIADREDGTRSLPRSVLTPETG